MATIKKCKKCGKTKFYVKEFTKLGRHPYYFVCVKCGTPHEVGGLI